METTIKKMSWRDVVKACRRLSGVIKENALLQQHDVIVPIIRGGLVPGTMLSHFLGGKTPIVPLQWQTRDGESDSYALNQLCKKFRTILFVDDLIDSGKTVNQISTHIENNFNKDVSYYFSVLKFNVESNNSTNMRKLLAGGHIRTAETYCAEDGQRIWWAFPWELE